MKEPIIGHSVKEDILTLLHGLLSHVRFEFSKLVLLLRPNPEGSAMATGEGCV